jgi:hypothetical protein
MFLNITPTVTNWTADNKQFSLLFDENPLADFVELPDDGKAQDELWFSNILCGVLRGALEMVRTRITGLETQRSLSPQGPNVNRGTFCERCSSRQRRYGDASHPASVH